MLTSIFKKSNPANYTILILTLTGFYFTIRFGKQGLEFTVLELLIQIAFCLGLIFTMLFLDFVSKRNGLSKTNTYVCLVFVLLIMLFPVSFLDPYILFSNIFVSLGLRPILALNFKRNHKKRILNASLYLAIASLLYFWAILFFIALFYAIIAYSRRDYKNFLIPFVGALAVFILVQVYAQITGNAFISLSSWTRQINIDFSIYNSRELFIPITLFLSLEIWISAAFFKNIRRTPSKVRPLFVFVNLMGMIALYLVAVSNPKTGSELLFLFTPFVFTMSNYLENSRNLWFKEILLWLMLLTPLLLYVFA